MRGLGLHLKLWSARGLRLKRSIALGLRLTNSKGLVRHKTATAPGPPKCSGIGLQLIWPLLRCAVRRAEEVAATLQRAILNLLLLLAKSMDLATRGLRARCLFGSRKNSRR